MTTLVNHEAANLALIALLAEAPNEVFAMAAKGGVLEEPRDELVVFHLTDVLLL